MKNIIISCLLFLFVGCTVKSQEPYKASLSPQYKLPTLVRYTVKKPFFDVKRVGKFRQVEGSLHPSIYKGSGWHRGHLFPADKAKNEAEMWKSFRMDNVIPMHPSLNLGVWRQLENYVTDLAETNDSILVLTGWSGKITYEGDLPVPDSIHKFLDIWKDGKNIRSEFYQFPNKKPEFKSYQIYRIFIK